MPLYSIDVLEIRSVRMVYIVEADTEDEVYEKAEVGDTVREVESSIEEVSNRIVDYDSAEEVPLD